MLFYLYSQEDQYMCRKLKGGLKNIELQVTFLSWLQGKQCLISWIDRFELLGSILFVWYIGIIVTSIQ